jgi:hypothetical protein
MEPAGLFLLQVCNPRKAGAPLIMRQALQYSRVRSIGMGVVALWAGLLAVELSIAVHGQSARSPRSSTQSALRLGKYEEDLARESKQEILGAGISGAYFARHFQLIKVINKPGDRRVVWRFRVNEFEATIDDSIGYYTAAGRQINVHSVAKLLKPAHDITRTISHARARSLMRACIGEFEAERVFYQGSPSGAMLVMMAQAREKKVVPRRDATAPADSSTKVGANRTAIQVGPNDTMRPPVLGTINLETGKCTKGSLLAMP